MIEAPQRQARRPKRVAEGANPSKAGKGRQRASNANFIGPEILKPAERGNPMGLPRVTPERTGQRVTRGSGRVAHYSREEIEQKAVTALIDVVEDGGAPAAAKAQAARTLLELNGLIGAKAKPPSDTGRPMSEMTLAEIEQELARLEGT